VQKNKDDIASMSFELALKELETIVRKLESGQGELESSIADFERGTALREYCQKKLTEARMKVEKIMQAADGTVSTQVFDTQ
jgi:exodeoxyribonuclease VII small subunit